MVRYTHPHNGTSGVTTDEKAAIMRESPAFVGYTFEKIEPPPPPPPIEKPQSDTNALGNRKGRKKSK